MHVIVLRTKDKRIIHCFYSGHSKIYTKHKANLTTKAFITAYNNRKFEKLMMGLYLSYIEDIDYYIVVELHDSFTKLTCSYIYTFNRPEQIVGIHTFPDENAKNLLQRKLFDKLHFQMDESTYVWYVIASNNCVPVLRFVDGCLNPSINYYRDSNTILLESR